MKWRWPCILVFLSPFIHNTRDVLDQMLILQSNHVCCLIFTSLTWAWSYKATNMEGAGKLLLFFLHLSFHSITLECRFPLFHGDPTEKSSVSSIVRLVHVILWEDLLTLAFLYHLFFSHHWSRNRRNSSSLFPQAGVWTRGQDRRVRSRHRRRTSRYGEHRWTGLWNGRIHYTPAQFAYEALCG